MKKILFTILIATILFASCTTRIKRPIDLDFTDIGKVEQELIELVVSGDINVRGREITTNRKMITFELEIIITNGQDVPTNEDERKAFAKSIARVVRQNLQDENKFEIYRVRFETRSESNMGHTSRHTTYTFNLTELEV